MVHTSHFVSLACILAAPGVSSGWQNNINLFTGNPDQHLNKAVRGVWSRKEEDVQKLPDNLEIPRCGVEQSDCTTRGHPVMYSDAIKSKTKDLYRKFRRKSAVPPERRVCRLAKRRIRSSAVQIRSLAGTLLLQRCARPILSIAPCLSMEPVVRSACGVPCQCASNTSTRRWRS